MKSPSGVVKPDLGPWDTVPFPLTVGDYYPDSGPPPLLGTIALPNAWDFLAQTRAEASLPEPEDYDPASVSAGKRKIRPAANFLKFVCHVANRAQPIFRESVRQTSRWLGFSEQEVQRLRKKAEAQGFIEPCRDERNLRALHKMGAPGSRTVQHYRLCYPVGSALKDNFVALPREWIYRLDAASLALAFHLLAEPHRPLSVHKHRREAGRQGKDAAPVGEKAARDCIRTLEAWGDVVSISPPGKRDRYYQALNKSISTIEREAKKRERDLLTGAGLVEPTDTDDAEPGLMEPTDTDDAEPDFIEQRRHAFEDRRKPRTPYEFVNKALYAAKYPQDGPFYWPPIPREQDGGVEAKPPKLALDILAEEASNRDFEVGELTRDDVIMLRSLLCENGRGYLLQKPISRQPRREKAAPGEGSERPPQRLGRWDRDVQLDEKKWRRHVHHFLGDKYCTRALPHGFSVLAAFYIHRARVVETDRITPNLVETEDETAARLTPNFHSRSRSDVGRFERAYFKLVEGGIDRREFSPREKRTLGRLLSSETIDDLLRWLVDFSWVFEHSRLDEDRVLTFCNAIPELRRNSNPDPYQEQRPPGFKPTKFAHLSISA